MSDYRILLVIDLQREFADRDNGSKEYNKVLGFLEQKENLAVYDKIISTVFRNGQNKNFRYNLDWGGYAAADESSLEYMDKISQDIHTVYIKDSYGTRDNWIAKTIHMCNTDISKSTKIDIIGCDLDACVMAICFQLWDAGITDFRVLTDYCYTTAKDFSKEDVIKLMKRNFGKCIVTSDEDCK